jgi:hypothetical protein
MSAITASGLSASTASGGYAGSGFQEEKSESRNARALRQVKDVRKYLQAQIDDMQHWFDGWLDAIERSLEGRPTAAEEWKARQREKRNE